MYKMPPPPLLPTNPPQNFSSTKALLDMVRNVSANQNPAPATTSVPERFHSPTNPAMKRVAESSSPLDLSSSMSVKRAKVLGNELETSQNVTSPPPSVMASKKDNLDSLLSWSVEDVANFIKTIDLCAEYTDVSYQHTSQIFFKTCEYMRIIETIPLNFLFPELMLSVIYSLQVFRDQKIDGWCLSLLTESHLTSHLKMKLGPALKLRSILASSKSRVFADERSCTHCGNHQNNINNNSTHQKDLPPHLQSTQQTSPVSLSRHANSSESFFPRQKDVSRHSISPSSRSSPFGENGVKTD